VSGASRRARAVLAQNLFVSQGPARKLVDHANVQPGDLVYDLGAGTGRVTRELIRAGARVVAVERDPNLVRKLAARFEGLAVTVREADLLEVPFEPPFKVVANLPFNVTGELLRRLLFSGPRPETAVLTLQREAARKYAGAPRSTTVSLSARPWFEPSVAYPFTRRDFAPIPGVDVALLCLQRRTRPDLCDGEAAPWRAFIRQTFARVRPDARGALRYLISNLQWRRLSEDLGLAPDALRADLTYDQWLVIFRFATAHAPAERRRRLGLP